MAVENLGGYAVRIGVVVLAIVMILFMLGRQELYPLWTVVMIGLVGGVAGVSLVRQVTD